MDGEVLGRMTEPKPPKQAAPHKPSPKSVAVRRAPVDYLADPADPFPLIAPSPERVSKPVPTGPAARSRSRPVPAARPAEESDMAASDVRSSSNSVRDGRRRASAPGVDAGSAAAPTAAVSKTAAVHSTASSHSRDHRPLRIAHLYPSLLNVAGDGGNLIAIQRRAQWRGIPVEVVAVEKAERPDFRKFDIVLFHGGQDVEMAVAAEDFAHKAPSLREAVADGVVVFAVCAGLQLLGHRYVSSAGEEMLGAGILDLETLGGPQRFMQHAACEVTIDGVTETIVGFENHSGLTTLGPGSTAFGRVVAGAGNNGRDGLEGARSQNVFATYLHGPCLPKNPWLTDQLIRIAVGRAEGVKPAKVVLAPLNDEVEARAHEVALAKAMANRGRRTALEPAKLVRGQ
jgi:lipid II isoglutaminyl synthase (glutamine-hydrolysing)